MSSKKTAMNVMPKEFFLVLVLKPVFSIIHFCVAYLATVLCSPFMVYGLHQHGLKLLSDYDTIFRLANNVPYFGTYFFSFVLSVVSPYTGSINPSVEKIANGEARVAMYDNPWIHNPFGCIHAVAITNLAEVTAGLAVTSCLQQVEGVRGIPLSQHTSWYAKARGSLVATAVCTVNMVPHASGRHEFSIVVVIKNEAKATVAESTLVWRVHVEATKSRSSKKRSLQ